MNRIYQPEIIEKVDTFINILSKDDFFKDCRIKDLSFTRNYLLDEFTELFIEIGSFEISDLFETEKFDMWIKSIVVGSLLYELKEKGLIGSYKDDDTEETFFLTDNGKNFLKKKEKEKRIVIS